MLNSLQHPELASRCPRKMISGLRRRGASVGIDADPAGDTRRRVPGSEILPILALGQQALQLVIAYAPPASRRTYASLFDRTRYGPHCSGIEWSATAEPEFLGPEERPDETSVVRGPRAAA